MLDVSGEFDAIALRNIDAAGVGRPRGDPVRPAKQSLEAIPAEPACDFAFIDADKGDHPEYHEPVLARLRVGGLTVIVLDSMRQGDPVVVPDTANARVIDG